MKIYSSMYIHILQNTNLSLVISLSLSLGKLADIGLTSAGGHSSVALLLTAFV